MVESALAQKLPPRAWVCVRVGMAEGNGSGSGISQCPDQQSAEPTALLILPLLLSLFWILLDLFYSSAILGWLVSRAAAFFLRDCDLHVGELASARLKLTRKAVINSGSIQINPLTGRILFKDVEYYCRDYSIR